MKKLEELLDDQEEIIKRIEEKFKNLKQVQLEFRKKFQLNQEKGEMK